jgi:hypothetical protein
MDMFGGQPLFGVLFVVIILTLIAGVWLVKHPYVLLVLNLVPFAWLAWGPVGAAGAVVALSAVSAAWR